MQLKNYIDIKLLKNRKAGFKWLMDGKNATSEYFRFNFSDFNYSTQKFEIRIGSNYFSSNRLTLNINQDLSSIKADLKFNGLNLWPRSFLAPGAMGWYAFIPFMECYHSVLSMDPIIKGFANFGGEDIDFSGGRGYTEKDWGVSFPQGWIWLQSNHFNKESTSVMLSIAKIPWRGRNFTGFLCGILHDKKFNIFATYNGSRIRLLQYSKDGVHVVLENKSYKITITANHQTSATLLSPIFGAMDGRISVSIDAIINVKLQNKVNNKEELIYEGTGYIGGLEIINPERVSDNLCKPLNLYKYRFLINL